MAKNTDINEEDGGMVRSPRYPALSLEQAVTKAKALYEADKTAGTPMRAVWGHIGYKAKSGPAAGALAAMKRFGLVDVRGERVFLTQRAIVIIRLPENDKRRTDALLEAVLAPALYKQLIDQYRETGLPSEESLNHELAMGGNFNHNAIPGLVKDFLDSLKYAGLTNTEGVLLDEGKTLAIEEDDENDGDDEEESETDRNRSKIKQRKMVAGTKEDVYTLDDGALVIQWPDRIRGASADDIDIWLKLVSSKLKRAVDAGKPDDGDERGE